MRKFFILTALIMLPFIATAQELKCNIQVVSQKIQRSNREIFRKLQESLYEFMNNTNWTNHVYSYDERIECNILINLTEEIGVNEFKGDMQIQSSRPVYNSSYNTVMLNYKDNDIRFTYIEDEPIEFSISSHMSNLSSILAYYAYIIIGFDYDSFSLQGGNEFFQNAETIVTNAQNARETGWKAHESSSHDNRYWLVHDILNNRYRPIREFEYKYHRQGMDKMADDVNEARATMAESLTLLQDVFRKKPDPFMHYLKVILDAKSNEFIKIFSESPPDEKNRVNQILTEIHPTNSSQYKKMMEQ
jgi:hypothetical protein